jgi:hypothetical protein
VPMCGGATLPSMLPFMGSLFPRKRSLARFEKMGWEMRKLTEYELEDISDYIWQTM